MLRSIPRLRNQWRTLPTRRLLAIPTKRLTMSMVFRGRICGASFDANTSSRLSLSLSALSFYLRRLPNHFGRKMKQVARKPRKLSNKSKIDLVVSSARAGKVMQPAS